MKKKSDKEPQLKNEKYWQAAEVKHRYGLFYFVLRPHRSNSMFPSVGELGEKTLLKGKLKKAKE